MAMQKFNRTRIRPWYLSVFLALGSVVMGGCDEGNGFALSLQPSYTASDLELDQGLAGLWATGDGDVVFNFEPSEGKAYKVVVKETEGERQSSTEFEAHLVRLGVYSFLDFFPTGAAEGSEFHRTHFLRAHSIARLEISHDKIQLAFLNGTWLREKVDEKSVDLSCQKTDGVLLLTGTTADVQDFLFLHANDEGAFWDPIPMSRQEAAK